MTNSLDRKPAISPRRTHKNDDPAWLWWLVAGSSIAAHLMLLSLTLPFSSRFSAASSSSNPIPIDLIELTPAPPAQSPAKPAAAPPPKPAATVPATSPAATPPALQSPNRPIPTAPTTSGDIAFAPAPTPPAPLLPAPTIPTSLPAQTPLTQTAAPLPQLDSAPLTDPSAIDSPTPPAPSSSPPPAGLTPPDTAPFAAPTAENQSPTSSESSAAAPATPASPTTPAAPQIVTLPIDVPVPDVSATLPIPPAPVAQALEQVETPQQAIPVMLTASLTAAEPAPDADALPDTIARPRQDSETFAADPRSSPCLITPEVIPYLGETVAVQVTTNEAGEATDAAVRQPSRSPIYDDLAVCMVKQWQFEPATTQGTPVMSNALVVAVRIQ